MKKIFNLHILKCFLVVLFIHDTTFAEIVAPPDTEDIGSHMPVRGYQPDHARKDMFRNYKKRRPFDIESRSIFKPKANNNARISWAGTYSCLSDVATGVWNSSGGIVESAWGTITDPGAAWDAGVDTFNTFYEFLGNIEESVGRVTEGISNLDQETVAAIVCTIVGEIGTSALIAYLTKGKNYQAIAAQLTGYVKKINGLGKILKLAEAAKGLAGSNGRINELIRRYIRGERTGIARDAEHNIEVLSASGQHDLAIDAFECALDAAATSDHAWLLPSDLPDLYFQSIAFRVTAPWPQPLPTEAFASRAPASTPSRAYNIQKYCSGIGRMAIDLDPKNINALIHKGLADEYTFMGSRLKSFEQARNMATDFPVTKKFGFDFSNPRNLKTYVCRNSFKDKPCGWEIKNGNDWARVRIDYEDTARPKIVNGQTIDVPPKKAHFNIEIIKDGKQYNYSVAFDCAGRVCSPGEMEKFRQNLFH